MPARHYHLLEARLGFLEPANLLLKHAAPLFEHLFHCRHRVGVKAQTFKQIELLKHGVQLKIGCIGSVSRLGVDFQRPFGIACHQFQFSQRGGSPNGFLTSWSAAIESILAGEMYQINETLDVVDFGIHWLLTRSCL